MTKHTYSDESLSMAVAASESYAGVLRHLGIPQAGGNQSHIKRRILIAGIDTSHFLSQGWSRGKARGPRRSAEVILVLGEPHTKEKTYYLRRALLEIGRPELCELCEVGPWHNGYKLVLEIDHISGEAWDHRPDNLRFLCPNCHSQQAHTARPWKYK